MSVDQVITPQLLVREHGFKPRTAQRALADLRIKLGKSPDSYIFASEFVAANKITFPKRYGELQRGRRMPQQEKDLEVLQQKSYERVLELNLIVGVTYEITYMLLGHYSKKAIATFTEFTESGITAIFKLPQAHYHEKELAMAVDYKEGQMNPIGSEENKKSEGYTLVRAVTECTTIGIPTLSIVEVKVI